MRMEVVSVREVIETYIGGGWGKEQPEDGHTVPAWVIRGTDIPAGSHGKFPSVPLRYHKPSNLKSRQLRPGDIVFEVSGGSKDQPLGRALMVKSSTFQALPGDVICASFCKLLRPNKERIDPWFLYYYLFHIYETRAVTEFQVQSTGISNFRFEEFLDNHQILVPDSGIQRRIIGVLAAFDELIEINVRRIEILEEMAQAIYREWFVDLRFPGYNANATGGTPEGWDRMNLFEVADVRYGFGFKSEMFHSGPSGQRVIRIRDIPRNTTGTFTDETPGENYEVRDGDVLVGMDGEFHMAVWHDGDALLNQRVARFRPKTDAPVLWLFHALREPIALFNATITGTTVAHLGDRHLRTVELLVPSPPIMQAARTHLDPIEGAILHLLKMNRNARAMRDLLLPKLISGQVDVSDLDIDTSWLAA